MIRNRSCLSFAGTWVDPFSRVRVSHLFSFQYFDMLWFACLFGFFFFVCFCFVWIFICFVLRLVSNVPCVSGLFILGCPHSVFLIKSLTVLKGYNLNPLIEKGQKTQWPKEKGQNDKPMIYKTSHRKLMIETKQTPLNRGWTLFSNCEYF